MFFAIVEKWLRLLSLHANTALMATYHTFLLVFLFPMHYTENSKHIFAEIKLRDFIPNFNSHLSGSDL